MPKKRARKRGRGKNRIEMYQSIGILAALILLGSILLYPSLTMHDATEQKAMHELENNAQDPGTHAKPSKTLREQYDTFQCSCCGRPIDANCCGMAKQGKTYLDSLLAEGLGDEEIASRMVKRFGFDILMDPSQAEEVRKYMRSRAPANPPRITIDNPQHDFGTIRQSDGVITTTFTLENSGENDLIIEGLDTSCMCTTASLIYAGKESPIFGMSMHGKNPEDFELRIPPGETALLKVYYDPMAHGVQKKPTMQIVREVTVLSNDPVDFQKKVRIDLTQIP